MTSIGPCEISAIKMILTELEFKLSKNELAIETFLRNSRLKCKTLQAGCARLQGPGERNSVPPNATLVSGHGNGNGRCLWLCDAGFYTNLQEARAAVDGQLVGRGAWGRRPAPSAPERPAPPSKMRSPRPAPPNAPAHMGELGHPGARQQPTQPSSPGSQAAAHPAQAGRRRARLKPEFRDCRAAAASSAMAGPWPYSVNTALTSRP